MAVPVICGETVLAVINGIAEEEVFRVRGRAFGLERAGDVGHGGVEFACVQVVKGEQYVVAAVVLLWAIQPWLSGTQNTEMR